MTQLYSPQRVFWEPGEADWTALFDVGIRPELLYSRYRFLNAVENSLLTRQDNQTPFVVPVVIVDFANSPTTLWSTVICVVTLYVDATKRAPVSSNMSGSRCFCRSASGWRLRARMIR